MAEYDLHERTKELALRIVWLSRPLPKSVEGSIMSIDKLTSLIDETSQLIAIFTTIIKSKKANMDRSP